MWRKPSWAGPARSSPPRSRPPSRSLSPPPSTSSRSPRWHSCSCCDSCPKPGDGRCSAPTPRPHKIDRLTVKEPHMNVEMVDEEQFLVRTVRDFIDREVKPAVNEMEHRNEYPEKFIEQMKQIGIYGLAIPEEYGGTPVSMPCYVQVTQELARGWMSLAGAMGGHTVVAKLLTLPGGGSDLQNMSTTAVADGEDHLVVNGSKTWISNARRSGLIALLCKTDPNASPAHAGVSILLVDKDEVGDALVISR